MPDRGEHIPDAAVEATTAAYQATEVAEMGCTCYWDENGDPPPGCRCAERNARARRERARAVVAAAVPHLVNDEAIVRAGAVFEAYCCGCLTESRAERAATNALRAALGIQDEQEDGHGK